MWRKEKSGQRLKVKGQNKRVMKYEEALKELDVIVQKMERNEYGIDELTVQLKKAKELIRECKDKLTKTDEDIKKILEDDK